MVPAAIAPISLGESWSTKLWTIAFIREEFKQEKDSGWRSYNWTEFQNHQSVSAQAYLVWIFFYFLLSRDITVSKDAPFHISCFATLKYKAGVEQRAAEAAQQIIFLGDIPTLKYCYSSAGIGSYKLNKEMDEWQIKWKLPNQASWSWTYI